MCVCFQGIACRSGEKCISQAVECSPAPCPEKPLCVAQSGKSAFIHHISRGRHYLQKRVKI